MKVLSRYVLKEHIAPFFFAFITITFLLIIEQVPKIVDHVIDKDLSIWVVLELIGTNLAWMLALSIPMSVLVATLMAFGRLSGDFEVTAMKACGINLLSILIPLLVAAGILSALMVSFNDRILPDLNKRARTLWGDISAMRPTLIFRSGMFIDDIPGYLILIDKIDHTTSRVEGVRITETKQASRPRVIVAENGYLQVTDQGRQMEFTLFNGEIHSFDMQNPEEYRKVDFQNQVINVTGAASELIRTDNDFRTDREMNIAAMREQVEENEKMFKPFVERIHLALREKVERLLSDSLPQAPNPSMTGQEAIVNMKADVSATTQTIKRNLQQINTQQRVVNKYQIEIYKKYSIPTASLAFILIGAPLGILTRRGGMGMAISVSILLFIVYWAFLIGGEDLADRGLIKPFWAMWSANILLAVIGIYLIYIVVTEKRIFSWFRRT